MPAPESAITGTPAVLPAATTTAARGPEPAATPDESAQRHWLAALVWHDEAALAALYRCHAEVVFGEALRLVRDPATAEKVAEDVFWQAWRQAPRFDPAAGTVIAWLGCLVHACARVALRGHAEEDCG